MSLKKIFAPSKHLRALICHKIIFFLQNIKIISSETKGLGKKYMRKFIM